MIQSQKTDFRTNSSELSQILQNSDLILKIEKSQQTEKQLRYSLEWLQILKTEQEQLHAR